MCSRLFFCVVSRYSNRWPSFSTSPSMLRVCPWSFCCKVSTGRETNLDSRQQGKPWVRPYVEVKRTREKWRNDCPDTEEERMTIGRGCDMERTFYQLLHRLQHPLVVSTPRWASTAQVAALFAWTSSVYEPRQSVAAPPMPGSQSRAPTNIVHWSVTDLFCHDRLIKKRQHEKN